MPDTILFQNSWFKCSIFFVLRWSRMARSSPRTGRRWDRRRWKEALQTVWSWRNGRSDQSLSHWFDMLTYEKLQFWGKFSFWRLFVASHQSFFVFCLICLPFLKPVVWLFFCSKLCDCIQKVMGVINLFHVIKCRSVFFWPHDIFVSFSRLNEL